ncbi:MAG: hypothetical protein C5B50_26550 [Verrucomicrobia bacterium]|nr:MAG: hypothetical protein C5B50_26550 [Verrucomicrobiota bacterium]
MFNLNQAIAEWRRQMASAGITSAEVLDELVSHLRDDVEEQVRTGANAEKAFASAVRRIGPAAALKTEFAKSGPPKGAWRRRFWQTFYYACAATTVMADLWTLVSFELSASERVAGAGVVVALAWYLLRRPFLAWWTGGVARTRLLSAMKAVASIVPIWTLWANLTAFRVIHIEVGVIPAMILWSLCAAFALTGLACGLNDRYGDGGSGGWSPPFYLVPVPIPPQRPCPPEFEISVPPASAFTPIAGKALEAAREEALRLGHDYIGTEHVLLGLLRFAGDAVAQVLDRSQTHRDAVRREIERLVSPLPALPASSLPPLTPRARKALRFARAEAAALKHPLISPEHVLLGLLIEGSGVAALALMKLGVRVKPMRAEISAIRAR